MKDGQKHGLQPSDVPGILLNNTRPAMLRATAWFCSAAWPVGASAHALPCLAARLAHPLARNWSDERAPQLFPEVSVRPQTPTMVMARLGRGNTPR
eukprot:9929299-Alexandrium_andersonii.AAC.2